MRGRSTERGFLPPVGARTEFSAGDTYIASFQERLLSGLEMIPGVERVGGINHFPLQGPGSNGSFILIDPVSNGTVGAGMILDRISESDDEERCRDFHASHDIHR